jgi:hypothetical protein
MLLRATEARVERSIPFSGLGKYYTNIWEGAVRRHRVLSLATS